jgi:hypothetical protein
MWALWWAVAAAEEVPQSPPDVACVLTVPVDTLASSLADATGAFANLDIEGFEAHAENVWRTLPCLAEPLMPLDVADVYKVRALDQFLAQDDAGVRNSLRSARAAVPDFRLPASVAPQGHPLQAAFDEASDDVAAREDLPVPSEARLLIDGQPVLSRPVDRAVIVQLIQADGAVAWTSLVEAGAAPPAYETLSDDYREAYLSGAKVIRVRPRRPFELVVASSASVVGAATMYGLSRRSRSQFFAPTTDYDDLASLRARTNGLQTAAVLTAAAGLGLGVTAAVTW